MYKSTLGANPERKQRKSTLGTRKRSIVPNEILISTQKSASKESHLRKFRNRRSSRMFNNTFNFGNENNFGNRQPIAETPHLASYVANPVKNIFANDLVEDKNYTQEPGRKGNILSDRTNTTFSSKLPDLDALYKKLFPNLSKIETSSPEGLKKENLTAEDKTKHCAFKTSDNRIINLTLYEDGITPISPETPFTLHRVEHKSETHVTDGDHTPFLFDSDKINPEETDEKKLQEELDNSFEKNETLLMQAECTISDLSMDNTLVVNEEHNYSEENVVTSSFKKKFKDTTILESIDEEECEIKELVDKKDVKIISSSNEKPIIDAVPESESIINQEEDYSNENFLEVVNRTIERQSQLENIMKQQSEELNWVKKYLMKFSSENKIKPDIVVTAEKESEDLNNTVVAMPLNSRVNTMMSEMRSDISFLKTPRLNLKYKKSTILTPHSMSFCIQNQFEKLLGLE